MKRTKRRKLKQARPRNPLAIAPVMKKGGAHQRVDKRASRARLAARTRRRISDESGSE